MLLHYIGIDGFEDFRMEDGDGIVEGLEKSFYPDVDGDSIGDLMGED